MDIAEGVPNALSDAALEPARRHLELNLEHVEQVHEEHGDCARADTSERVVLQIKDAAHTPINEEVG